MSNLCMMKTHPITMQARDKAESLGLVSSIKFKEMDVGSLSYPDKSFDTVVDTFSLCVFPDPRQALHEIARVVKPYKEGGRVLLLENSRSDWGPVGLYQDLTGSMIASMGGKGCVWNQDVTALAREAGLTLKSEVPILGGIFRLLEAVKEGTS